ncbi:MAG: ABC transporter permease, partial [Chloroflexi bacterium]
MRAIPGGPFDFAGDKSLPKSVVQNLERRNHLDWELGWQFSSYVLGDDITGGICKGLPFLESCKAVIESYGLGVSQGLIRGDLGMALKLRGRTVNDLVKESFPISLQLGVLSIALALLIGIPAGILSALKQNSWVDYTSSFFAVLGLSIPNIVLGPLLIWIFALTLGWFAVATWGAKPPFILGFIPTNLFSWEFWSHAILPAFTLGTAF